MSNTEGKLYHSIGEVAKMFGVNTSLIRYWEKEFGKWIKPHRTKSGSRYFTNEDIEQIREIYNLVKIEGYTLQGAKDALNERKEEVPDMDHIKETLIKTKSLLQSILDKNNPQD